MAQKVTQNGQLHNFDFSFQSYYGRSIPIIIYGVMSIIAGLLALLLPETKGQNLPETLEDGENFGR